MGKPDKETFHREVRRIRRDYGGDRDWDDTAELFAHHLYWRRRELDREEDAPVLDRNLRGMIRRSHTNKYLWDAVNLIARLHLTRGDSLPEPLAEWIERVLVDQHLDQQEKLRPRPGKGSGTAVRDWVICMAVESLDTRIYTPTRSGGRNEASAMGGSGCDIVGAAFFKSYKTIEGIWLSRHTYPSTR